MAFELFCPTKSNKSTRKSTQSQEDMPKPTASNHDNGTSTTDVDTGNSNVTVASIPNLIPCLLQVMKDYSKFEDDEIDVRAGDFVLWPIPAADDPAWTRVFNISTSEQGFVPTDILSEPNAYKVPKKKRSRSIALNSVQGSSGCAPSYYNLNGVRAYNKTQPFITYTANPHWYLVTHNFIPREESDLEVREGEFVIVLNSEDRDWSWVRRAHDHQEGFVPANFIVPFSHFEQGLLKH